MKFPAVLSRIASAIRPKAYSAVPSGTGGWFGVIRESFSGAFQSNVEIDAPKNILAFSAVFSCITLIASDISKLCLELIEEDENGIELPVASSSPYWRVLRKPNHFQNRIKFIEQWIISKLLYGNAFMLKQRDNRGMVVALYVLDAQRVTPLVTETGDVYYQLSADHLAGLLGSVTIPASEIIHDRMNCLWHPLVGISPIYACGASATMGNKIQANSSMFFANMSRPGGMLTAPSTIDDETAIRLKADFEANFSGSKIGRLFVAGDGLTYQGMSMPAEQAQLIEQLKWTVEDVARCFHVPLFKVGGSQTAGNLSIDAQQQQYLNDCLHIHIEDIETCLDEGLELPARYHADIEEDGLLRMDKAALYESLGNGVNGGWMAPNEARAKVGLKPVQGGESPYLQQQNYSLAALAKRDSAEDPFGKAAPPAPTPMPALPAPAKEFNVGEFVKRLGQSDLVVV